MNWKQICFCAALLTALFVVVPSVMVGLATPGYSHSSQFISELGARGAPLAHVMNLLGFLPAGIFGLVFAVSAWRAFPRSTTWALGLVGVAAYSMGYLVAVPFPCDPGCRPAEPSLSQLIHNAGGLLGYLLAPLSLLLLSLATRKWADARHLAAWAVVGAFVSLVGLSTMSPESPWVGISQRLIEASMLGWIVLCGLFARRTSLGSDAPA